MQNPHLNHDDYLRKLRAACGNDEALFKAFAEGDWSVARGAFFAGCLDPKIHMLPIEFPYQLTKIWRPFISHDWGSSAPSVTILFARAPGDIGPWPRNSLLALDEVATFQPNDLNAGLNWPPGKVAEEIWELAERYKLRSIHGVGDDARGLSDDTLLKIFADHKINLVKPIKSRVGGWAKCKEYLFNATRPEEGLPGLWISARCKYGWKTLPYLPRDPSRPEDLDSGAPDHFADSLRYGILHGSQFGARSGRTTGMY